VFKEMRNNRSVFEVESLKDRSIRGDLARAVVESGWNLNELRSAAMSLEDIFLQLTATEQVEPQPEEVAVQGAN
jgi:ABC-2 type transport system ATP-binding protein